MHRIRSGFLFRSSTAFVTKGRYVKKIFVYSMLFELNTEKFKERLSIRRKNSRSRFEKQSVQLAWFQKSIPETKWRESAREIWSSLKWSCLLNERASSCRRSTRSSLPPFCAFLFQQRLVSEGRNDTLIGHLIVLLQYDWPKEEGTFYELLEKIRDNRGLKYRVFFDYVNSILWMCVVHLTSFSQSFFPCSVTIFLVLVSLSSSRHRHFRGICTSL
mgnify:CR=1 FL=1